MAIQNNTNITVAQKKILNLEKKYFNELHKIVSTGQFQDDLKKIEEDIRSNYTRYENIWNLKNKLKVAAERLVTHHVYLASEFRGKITGLYPSAVSSDIGLQTEDAIICIDVKTNDINNNKGDFNNITAEKNQISFDNQKYPLIPTTSNLNPLSQYAPYYPIITIVVKIGYNDDGMGFNLVKNNSNYPTIQVACIPNGKLSSLFDYNIIQGFKTYKYSTDKADVIFFDSKESALESFDLKKSLIKIPNTNAYRDIASGKIWTLTSKNKKPCMCVLVGGDTARINVKMLENRLDSSNDPWSGYKTIVVK